MKACILVATFKGKTWVVDDADFDLDWEVQAQGHISNKDAKFTYKRATALLIAHNVQRKSAREAGVWEVFLKANKQDATTESVPPEAKAKKPDTKAKKPDTKAKKPDTKGSK
jgi:hypothetical protein